MRTKLTTLIALGAALAAAAAHAAPVTVALYTFATRADVLAFQKTQGAKCKKKWRGTRSMQVIVGARTTACGFRTSVVADSSDERADAEVDATVSAITASRKLQKKAFVGVAVRSSDTAGYELRVRPYARKWQLFRDPKGSEGPTLYRSGKGKFIRTSVKKGNFASLRAFDYGTTTTTLLARINGKTLVSVTDSANGQPDGRRTVVTAGVKGKGAGTGVVGVYDNVAIKVPNPF
jgi:hypothetical protein